jgi:hypothetical protein
MDILVLPQIASPIQILHRRWIRMVRVEITDRIGARVRCLALFDHGAVR